jgi:hypothetical protein
MLNQHIAEDGLRSLRTLPSLARRASCRRRSMAHPASGSRSTIRRHRRATGAERDLKSRRHCPPTMTRRKGDIACGEMTPNHNAGRFRALRRFVFTFITTRSSVWQYDAVLAAKMSKR